MANEPGNTEVPKLTRKNLAKHTLELHRFMSTKDALTGLNNRVGLKEDWKKAHSLLERGELNYKFLFLDLDKFKAINDVDKKHAFGDSVLRNVADTFRKIIRPEDMVGRVGGDEFAVVMVGNRLDDDETIQKVFEQRFKEKFQEIMGPAMLTQYPQLKDLGVSVGVVEPNTNDTFESLYDQADALMYARKSEKGEAR